MTNDELKQLVEAVTAGPVYYYFCPAPGKIIARRVDKIMVRPEHAPPVEHAEAWLSGGEHIRLSGVRLGDFVRIAPL